METSKCPWLCYLQMCSFVAVVCLVEKQSINLQQLHLDSVGAYTVYCTWILGIESIELYQHQLTYMF